MPLIPSYIARLRTHSQSTAATSSSQSGSRSNSTAGPPTPGPEFARLAIDPPAGDQGAGSVGPAPQEQVARKIHPNLSALLDENAAADGAVEDLGPRPPRGRSRSVGQLVSMKHETGQNESEGQSVQHTDATPPGDVLDAPASPRSPLLSRILSAPLLGNVRSAMTTPTSSADGEPDPGGLSMHWSTFGKRRTRMPPMGEFGSLHRRGSGSKSSSQSKSSKRKGQQRSTPVTPTATRPPSAHTSTPSRAQTVASTNETPPSQTDSPVGTFSSSSGSKSYSQHSHSIRSRRQPQAYPEPIPDLDPSPNDEPRTPNTPFQPSSTSPFTPIPAIVSPRPTNPHLDDSPQTFGRVTPKRSDGKSTSYSGLGGAFRPPLSSTPPLEQRRQQSLRGPPSTYPPRSRKRPPVNSNTVSFPSLPLSLFARSQSRPRAEDVFRDGDGADRRISADWSAAEATRSGNVRAGETWPAIVSREMVRLSLSGHNATKNAVRVPMGSGEGGTEVGEAGTLSKEGSKNPTLFGSTGEERRRFLRVGRRETNPGATVPVMSSSPITEQQSPSLPLRPAFSVSLPLEHSTPDPKSSAIIGEGSRAGGLAPPHVSVTAPTPSASPSGSRMNAMSDPGPSGSSVGVSHHGTAKTQAKRKKADSEDEAPPNELGTRSILLSGREASNHTSDASYAPSSFRQPKRIRLSTPANSPPHDNLSRSISSLHQSPPGSPRSRPPSSLRTLPAVNPRTLSQSSIPLRAIVSPRPPSIDRRSIYHMRDPALPPPRRQSTQWTGSARKSEEVDKRVFPLQGWAFIIGFLIFPLWWVAAAAPVGWGWGRSALVVQDGKGVWTEEDLAAREVMEYDIAYTWRQRCRFMSLLGLLVYVPLIVLLAVLVPRT